MDNNLKPKTIKIFKPSLVITMVFAAVLGVFAVFNQHKVLCSITGYQLDDYSMAAFILWSFLAGVVYIGLIGSLYIVKLKTVNRYLKRTLKEMNEEHEQGKA
jgi:uncharacterized integral membrane protein